MRQLGARLPELPPVKTDVETPSEIQPHERHPVEAPEPYPVEVHRIERRPIEAAPVEPLPVPEPTTIRVSPEPIARAVAPPPAILEPTPAPAAEAQGPPEPSAEPVAAAAAVAETQASPVLAAAPVIAAQTPPEPIAETTAVTQAPTVPTTEPLAATQAAMEAIAQPQAEEPIAEPVAMAQAQPVLATVPVIAVPESIAEPVVAPQTPSEPIAERAAAAQAPPVSIAGRPAETHAATKAEPIVAAPQRPPAPVAPAPATQAPPEPVSPRIRITEAPQNPQNMVEPPLRRPPEPRSDSRRELRPIPDVAQEFPEPNLNGRWAEFHDFRRLEPGREGRISLEPLPPPLLTPRGLLSADREPEHRSSFLTIAVPGIAAILAVGALLWSGSLRDRVLRQDAQMTALQQQNRKLADALAQMNVDQKVVGALNASGSAPTNAADQPTQNPTSQTGRANADAPAPSGNDSAQAANAGCGCASPEHSCVTQASRVERGKTRGCLRPALPAIVGAAEGCAPAGGYGVSPGDRPTVSDRLSDEERCSGSVQLTTPDAANGSRALRDQLTRKHGSVFHCTDAYATPTCAGATICVRHKPRSKLRSRFLTHV